MLSIRVKIKRRSSFDNTVFRVRDYDDRYIIKKNNYNDEYGIYSLGGSSLLCNYREEKIFQFFKSGTWIKVKSNYDKV
jgi:hypothetical protein